MNYQQAVSVYQANPTNEVLHEQVEGLNAELTLKEKIFLLSGQLTLHFQKDMLNS